MTNAGSTGTGFHDPLLDDEAFSASSGQQERPLLDGRALWALTVRNGRLILSVVSAALVIGVAIILLTTPRYEARASIQIDQQTARVLRTEDQDPAQSGSEAERFLQTQVDIIKSRALAARVSQSLGLAVDDRFLAAMRVAPTIGVGAAARRSNRVLDQLQGNLRVSLPATSRVVELAFVGPDPVIAARVANRYAAEFIAANIQRRYSTTSYAREFLQSQLDRTRARLEASERDLNSYARAAQIVDTSAPAAGGQAVLSVRSPTVANLLQLNQALSAAQAGRAQAQEKWETSRRTPLMDLPDVLSNPAILQLTQQRAILLGNIATLEERLTAQHPSIVQANLQLTQIQKQITSLAASIRNSIRSQSEVAARQETELRRQVAELQQSTFSEQDRSVRLNILRRDADTNRQLYESLLNRYKEVSASAGVVANNVTPVDTAEVPRSPFSPNVRLIMAAALGLGVAMAALLVFARDWLDDVIRSPQDFEDKLQLPLLSVIPRVKGDNALTALADHRSTIAEAYHSLRTAIELSSASGVPASLLITSSRKGEGKSTTSLALARDFAASGRRTLLIDADLRNPTLHRLFALPWDTPGFSNLMARQIDAVAAIRSGDVDNLSLIVGGPTPPDAARLLAGNGLREVLAVLREQYDLIVLDGPPVLSLADALLIGAQAAGVVYVVEAGNAHFGVAKNSLRRLRRARVRLIGGLLTKFDARSTGYGAEYYGYRYDRQAD